MTIKTFQERVSRISGRMMSLLLCNVFGQEDGQSVTLGLPAGAVHLMGRKLIVAATVCDEPVFRQPIKDAAAKTGSDVLLAHHGFHPETLNHVFFSVLVHIGGEPHHFERMILYFHAVDGYWLVPEGRGPFIALEEDGLRVDHEPPFLTIHQRADGVCAGARIIVQRTANAGIL